ncbi:SMI1/KNR4 family protein [Streptomyces sp. NPDC049879]|uniref:SMI1/KNR4 family protein n=1 Tax=Streptomyces sp. NPDC049879 TaxID=3365598 RepID=UPI0037ADF57C
MVEKVNEGGVGRTWDRIERWLARHAPATYATLRPPAARDDVAALEEEFGIRLPGDLVASLLRHDGVTWPGQAAFALPGRFYLLDVAAIREHCAMWRRLAEREDATNLRDGSYWHPSFLTVAGTNAADAMFVDCRPGERYGVVGWHIKGGEPYFGPRLPFAAMLGALADALEADRPLRGLGESLPVAFAGRLLWEKVWTPHPDPGSLLDLAAGIAPTEPSWGVRTLIVARGLTPTALLGRMGAPAAPAGGPVPEPNAALPQVRVGREGEWAFAVAQGHWEAVRPEVLRRVSRGTVAVAVTPNDRIAPLIYEDGHRVPPPPAPAGPEAPERHGGLRLIAGGAGTLPPGAPDMRVPSERAELSALCERLAALPVDAGITPGVLAGTMAAAPPVPVLPVLPDIAPVPRPMPLVAEVVDGIPGERLGPALVTATARLAEATGLGGHREVADALTDLRAGRPVPVSDDSPLGLRLRRVLAEAAAPRHVDRRDVERMPTGRERLAWQQRGTAAKALLAAAALPPREAADHVFAIPPTPRWRAELLRDTAEGAPPEDM